MAAAQSHAARPHVERALCHNLLLDVLSRLCVRDLLGGAAAACRRWDEAARSKNAWRG
jgi:hypothetical protein